MTPLDKHLHSPLDQRVADALWKDCMWGLAEVELDGTFRRVNPAFCRLTGYTAAELEGRRNFQSITHRDDIDPDERSVRRLISGEDEDYVMQKRYITKFEKVIRIVLKVVPIFDEQGAVSLLLAQVAPAEDVKTTPQQPVVRKDADPGFGEFFQKNWKWLIAVVVAVLGFVITEWVRYQELTGRVNRMEQNDVKILEKLEELKKP